jgi:hypothetical protein
MRAAILTARRSQSRTRELCVFASPSNHAATENSVSPQIWIERFASHEMRCVEVNDGEVSIASVLTQSGP